MTIRKSNTSLCEREGGRASARPVGSNALHTYSFGHKTNSAHTRTARLGIVVLGYNKIMFKEIGSTVDSALVSVNRRARTDKWENIRSLLVQPDTTLLIVDAQRAFVSSGGAKLHKHAIRQLKHNIGSNRIIWHCLFWCYNNICLWWSIPPRGNYCLFRKGRLWQF